MTKDELKKEAEKYAEQCYGWTNNGLALDVAEATYIASAEPREKRIAELEKENEQLKADYKVLSCSVGDFGKLQDKFEEEQRKNNGLSDNLAKATEIIKNLLILKNDHFGNTKMEWRVEVTEQAEQFLKENE